jgi:hypothetical protein
MHLIRVQDLPLLALGGQLQLEVDRVESQRTDRESVGDKLDFLFK